MTIWGWEGGALLGMQFSSLLAELGEDAEDGSRGPRGLTPGHERLPDELDLGEGVWRPDVCTVKVGRSVVLGPRDLLGGTRIGE